MHQSRPDNHHHHRGRDADIGTGQGQSLATKKLYKFGDLAVTQSNQEMKKMIKQAQRKRAQVQMEKSIKAKHQIKSSHNELLISVEDRLAYQPKLRQTKLIYQNIVQIVQKYLGDQPQSTLLGAVDQVLAAIKTDDLTDNQRKLQVQSMLSKISDGDWNKMVVYAKHLKDYQNTIVQGGGGDDPSNNFNQVDLPVNFDQVEEVDDDDDNHGTNGGRVRYAGRDIQYVIEDDEDQEVDDQFLDDESKKRQEQVMNDNMREQSKRQQTNDDDDLQKLIEQSQTRQQGTRQVHSSQIDAFWLQKQISEYYTQATEVVQIQQQIIDILSRNYEMIHQIENELVPLFQFQHFELVKLILQNKDKIFQCHRLAKCSNAQEKQKLKEEMKHSKQHEVRKVYKQLFGDYIDEEVNQTLNQQIKSLDKNTLMSRAATQQQDQNDISQLTKQIIDLKKMTNNTGWHSLQSNKLKLHAKPIYSQFKGYDQIDIPPATPPPPRDGQHLIKVKNLPRWMQPAFLHITQLNRIQSAVYKTAFQSDQNLLICAPTSAGKTNIALFTICRVLDKFRIQQSNQPDFNRNKFKIVYIAPMKALVSETVGNFHERFNNEKANGGFNYNIKVRELTGDMQLSKEQIDDTQIIVTTPEKWDIVTRKSGERTFLQLVQLVIIDEIHMLHDERGPVLEAILSRILRQRSQGQLQNIRTVALSATLPNYKDVAAFLRIDIPTPQQEAGELANNPQKSKGLFYFDKSYRPVPLEQSYIGITQRKAIKKMLLMNEITYQKVIERKTQTIVFVHSRKQTGRTARAIKDTALNKDQLGRLIGQWSHQGEKYDAEFMQEASKLANSDQLKQLLPYGIGIHHAGLSRNDRTLVESLFADHKLKVLVSTATLAWGVNLPAHTVIIKGTQIYSAKLGKWVQLSGQDILQMMGRAGRKGLDTKGQGILITSRTELQVYLNILNSQLPIESQFVSQLADHLNAEVVGGSVTNIRDAVNWLAHTYLYIRMLISPQLYHVTKNQQKTDPYLIKKRADLCHSAAILLEKANLLHYQKRTGMLQSSNLGRIASHYYIKYDSMEIYNKTLQPTVGIIQLFRIFTLSKQFQQIPVREQQKPEIQQLLDKVPIPVKGSIDQPTTKINILLQAYISRYSLQGFSLSSDMIYITQSAGRIFRALFQLSLHRQYSNVIQTILQVCKMVERRMWQSMTPLRQFLSVDMKGKGGETAFLQRNQDILFKLQNKEQFTWQHYREMSVQNLGELVRSHKNANYLYKLIHQIPHLEVSCFSQTLTRNTIRLHLELQADFTWERQRHGRAEAFWVFVENVDGETLYHSEYVLLSERVAINRQKQVLSFVVPLMQPIPPCYFIKVISDRWIAAQTTLPVSFKHLYLPSLFPQPTKLLDMQQLPISELKFPEGEEILSSYLNITHFNSIQTQCFNALYRWKGQNVFIGAAVGSGKSICAEIAIMSHIQQANNQSKIIYLCPQSTLSKLRYTSLRQRYQNLIKVSHLIGDMSADQRQFRSSRLIISTAQNWDQLSRNYSNALYQIGLCIIDDFQYVSCGSESTILNSGIMEVVISKLRMFTVSVSNDPQFKDQFTPCRIVLLTVPIANYIDVAQWIGASKNCTLNFHPATRPGGAQLQLHIQSQFPQNYRNMRLQAMYKPAYMLVKKEMSGGDGDSKVMIFVDDDKKNTKLTALQFINIAASDGKPTIYRGGDQSVDDQFEQFIKTSSQNFALQKTLQHCLKLGVGYLHSAMSDQAVECILQLYNQRIVRVLVVSADLCWRLDQTFCDLSIVLDPMRFDYDEHRYVDYSTAQIYQMLGRAQQSINKSKKVKGYVFCHSPKKKYFLKVLQQPLPLQSQLDFVFAQAINSEIVLQNVQTTQDAIDWLTWTLLYRRIRQNPNFYNMFGASQDHIKDYMSEQVEGAFEELQTSNCISYDKGKFQVKASLMGKIAKQYYVSTVTIDRFSEGVEAEKKKQQGDGDGSVRKKKMTIQDILSLISNAVEFEQRVKVRDDDGIEAGTLRMINELATFPINKKQFSCSDKVQLLLQAHFSRLSLPSQLSNDLKTSILVQSVRLTHALISVLLAYGQLSWALLGIDFCSMLVQGMWYTESNLLQLPYFNKPRDQDANKLLQACNSAGITSIQDLMNMQDENERKNLLKMSDEMLEDVARVCNRFPLIEITIEDCKMISFSGQSGKISVKVSLERDLDLDDDDDNVEDVKNNTEQKLQQTLGAVYSPFYPQQKEEVWWVLVVDNNGRKVLGFKRLSNFVKSKTVEIRCQVEGNTQEEKLKKKKYMLYLLCDSWIGCDQEEVIQIRN